MKIGVHGGRRSVELFGMQDLGKQKATYTVLTWVFAIAGVAWIIGGVLSVYHRFLYPLIGVANLGIAYICRRASK